MQIKKSSGSKKNLKKINCFFYNAQISINERKYIFITLHNFYYLDSKSHMKKKTDILKSILLPILI